MLGARTKTVASYGRRGHRVVAVSDERRDKDQSTRATGLSQPVSRPDIGKDKSSYAESVPSSRESTPPSSPEYKPQKLHNVAKNEKAAKGRNAEKIISRRKPLSAVSANVPSAGPSSSFMAKAGPRKPKPKVTAGKASTPPRVPVSLKPISPVVSVEIIILDDEGKQINVEKRTTKPTIPVSRARPRRQRSEAKRVNTTANAIVLSDDEDDIPIPLHRPRKQPPRRRVVESSSEDDSDVEIISGRGESRLHPSSLDSPPPRFRSPAERRNNIALSSPESVASTSNSVKLLASPRPRVSNPNRASPGPKFPKAQDVSHNNEHKAQRASIAQSSRRPLELAAPDRSKPRPLTPIRSRAAFPIPPSPPSPASDSDLDDPLAFDFSELALSPNTVRGLTATGLNWEAPTQPAYLKPLLQECGQVSPHEFSAFIEMFPFDQIVQTSHDGVDIRAVAHDGPRARPAFRKIGEASYSEVFGIGDVVLKIVPLRNEEGRGAAAANDANAECPSPSDAKDVLKEIIVTRAMGDMCSGFTELLRSYVVRGRYPSLLLDLWDDYHERKGSESVRPDGFAVSQVYAIIVLPNGGPDLESYSFATAAKAGWRQACSLFWQVARALAQAEKLVAFEHRDLHWGQILVKNVSASADTPHRGKRKASMDSDVYGIQATIIDLGLSRMNSGAGSDAVHWTTFDAETFEGEGDYQFDVYRMMKAHIEGSWKEFRPLTNVMWLHYLLDKLLHAKRLRKPIAPKKAAKASAPPAFTELECWECLTEVEGVLRGALDDVRRATAKNGRRKTQAAKPPREDRPTCAGAVVELAYARGWLAG